LNQLVEAVKKENRMEVVVFAATQLWLNHFTRIGFVSNHKKHIENIEAILEDSLKQFFVEKNRKNRDERRIQQLKSDIRENTKLLSELNLGTPIISAIKTKVEGNEKGTPVST
jgi:mevalonate kinase